MAASPEQPTTGVAPLYVGGSSVPVPDPTMLTAAAQAAASAQSRRELEAAIELAATQNDAVQRVIETRLNAMDVAIELVRSLIDSMPARMDEKIEHLRELHDQRLLSIDEKFRLLDVRIEQNARDRAREIDAALAAQEKAASRQAEAFGVATQKSEDQFTKQIDTQGELLRTATRGLEDKITDLKDRFNRGEGMGTGKEVATKDVQNLIFALLGVAGVVAGIVIALVRGG